MSHASGIPLKELQTALFLWWDRDAVSHLLSVGPGLAGMGGWPDTGSSPVGVSCRPELQGVWEAAEWSFQGSTQMRQEVQNETSICLGAASVSSVTVELAQLKLATHNFDDARFASWPPCS